MYDLMTASELKLVTDDGSASVAYSGRSLMCYSAVAIRAPCCRS